METNAGSRRRDWLRTNNFDLLRLLLALAVLFDHSHHLSKVPALQWLDDSINVDRMLQGFFIISGFLIVMSYEKSRSLRDYAERRLRRIYPAYFVVVLLCFALGFVMTEGSRSAFLHSFDTVKYLVCNLLFLNFVQPDLPGVFAHQIEPALDGSLWSLKVEMMFYACVPIIVWLIRRTRVWPVLLTIYVLSWGYKAGFDYLAAHSHLLDGKSAKLMKELGKQLFGQLSFFMAGAACYYYREGLARHAHKLFVVAALIVYVNGYLPLGFLLPAALGIVVIWLACFAPYLGNAGKYGDVSYGVYIYHFPILQTLIACGLFGATAYGALGLGLLITFACAWLSWHFVEKRWLRPSSHYRQVETTADSPAPSHQPAGNS